MEFKGTKGKWIFGTAELINDNKQHLIVSPIDVTETDDGFRSVCSISILEKLDDEDLANALLISKAPEMLKMLERIMKTYDKGTQTYLDCQQLIKEATEL